MKKILLMLLAISFGLQIIDVDAAASSRKRGAANAAQHAQALPQLENALGIPHPRVNFVLDVLGMTEKVFANARSAVDDQEAITSFMEICRAFGFNPGHFEQKSLAELRRDYDAYKRTHIPSNKGSIHVIGGNDPLNPANPLVYHQVHIGAIQAEWGMLCQNMGKRLTVMVESNLNCLQTTQKRLTEGLNSDTPGTSASISAAPGTLLRHYFGCDGRMQSPDVQVNLLDEALHGLGSIRVNNGRLELPTVMGELRELAWKISSNSELIKVGVHRGISVSHGFSTGGHHKLLPKEYRPQINQVFCTALDVRQLNEELLKSYTDIASMFIDIQIEAALLAAALNNTDIFVMPLLGCDDFGNHPMWVLKALNKHKDFIIASGMRVVLNIFDSRMVALEIQDKLNSLVQKTGGTYTDYSQDGNNLIAKNLHGQVRAMTTTPPNNGVNPQVARRKLLAPKPVEVTRHARFPFISSEAFVDAIPAPTQITIIRQGNYIEKQDFGAFANTAAIVNAANPELMPVSDRPSRIPELMPVSHRPSSLIDQLVRIAVTGSHDKFYPGVSHFFFQRTNQVETVACFLA